MKPVHPFLAFLLFTCLTAAAQRDGSIRAVLADRFCVTGLPSKKLWMLITHVGYPNFNRHFLLTDLVREINFDSIFLHHRSAMLNEVIVEQESLPSPFKTT